MEITWNIIKLKSSVKTGLVFEINYVIYFKYRELSDRFVGILNIDGDTNSDEFIVYEDLTEQKVIGWVKSILGEEMIEEIEKDMLVKFLSELNNGDNTSYEVGLPWVNNIT